MFQIFHYCKLFHLGFKLIFGGDLKPSLLDNGLSLEKKEKFWVIRKSSGALVVYDHFVNVSNPGSISNQLFDPSLGSESLTTPSKTWAPGASSSPILSPSLNSSIVQNTSFHSTVLNLRQTVLEEDKDDGNKILSEEDKDKLDTLIEKGGERYLERNTQDLVRFLIFLVLHLSNASYVVLLVY